MRHWKRIIVGLLLTVMGLGLATVLDFEHPIADASPVLAGPASPMQPTPPFPTLIPTEPLPTLPPSVPTPAPFTPTATLEPEATPIPTQVTPSPVPASPTPDHSPTPTSYLGLSDTIWLPFAGLFHSFNPFDLPTPESRAGASASFR